MQNSIRASLHHSVYNDDASIQHKFCTELWCKCYVDQQSKTSTYDHENQKKKKLPPSF